MDIVQTTEALTTADDTSLIAAHVTGEAEAFATLVRRHHGLVHAACVRQSPSSEVEDCIQAVFLVLHRRPRQAARAPALAAWLLTVARFVCARARRAVRSRRQAEIAAAEISAQRHARSPAMGQPCEHLDACLAALPERQRLVVSLHYLAGHAPEDISAQLGLEPATVRQNLHRGLVSLRSALRRRGVVVPAAGLLALLAQEAHAAAVCPPLSLIPGLTTSVTATNAVIYAQGTIKTMILKSLIPTVIGSTTAAACLLVGVLAFGAEPATAPAVTRSPAPATTPAPATAPSPQAEPATTPAATRSPAPATTPAPATAPSPQAAMFKALEQPVSVDYADSSMESVVNDLRQKTKIDIVLKGVVAADLPSVSMQMSGVKLRLLLGNIEKLSGLGHEIEGSQYILRPGLIPKPVP